MLTILITGAAGNIGASLVEKLLLRPGTHVVGVDNLITGSMDKIPFNKKNFEFKKIDANEYRLMSALFSNYKFDYVFHFAAIVGVRRTTENPLMVFRDIDGIKNVVTLSSLYNVKRVYFSSSSEVYGEPVSLPQFEETTPLNSRLPYAVVKNLGEAYLRSFQKEHGLEYTTFRFFNTYGPRQSEDFVIPRFLKSALSGTDILIYGDGRQTRTFCYIDDNIDTIVGCLNSGSYNNQIVNVGSDIQVSIIDLARLIKDKTGSRSSIRHLPPLTEGDMSKRCPDISKMRQILQREPIPLEKGIELLIERFRTSFSTDRH
jgi:UDP-glucuronate decarboxylase